MKRITRAIADFNTFYSLSKMKRRNPYLYAYYFSWSRLRNPMWKTRFIWSSMRMIDRRRIIRNSLDLEHILSFPSDFTNQSCRDLLKLTCERTWMMSINQDISVDAHCSSMLAQKILLILHSLATIWSITARKWALSSFVVIKVFVKMNGICNFNRLFGLHFNRLVTF